MASSHLRKVSGSEKWYAVLSIPPEVRSGFNGRTQFVKATRTSDKKEAERIAGRLVNGWLDEIHAVRKCLPSPFQSALESGLNGLVDKVVEQTVSRPPPVVYVPNPRPTEVDRRMVTAEEEREADPYMKSGKALVRFQEGEKARLEQQQKDRIIREFLAEMGGAVQLMNNMLTNGGIPVMPTITKKATPFLHHMPEWETKTHLKGKTKGQAITEIQRFAEMVPVPIEQLSGGEVEDWIEALRAEGKLPSTIRVGMSKIRSYWKWMMRHKYVTIDPFADRFLPDGRSPKEKRAAKRQGFTPADLTRLVDATQDEDLRRLILIAMYSGARRESIVTLTVDQIVTIRGVKCFHFEDKTEAGIRYVPVHSELLPLMKQMEAGAKNGFLFHATARGKNRYSAGDRLGKKFAKMTTPMGFPKTLVFHSIRHSVAEQLKEKGCTLPTMQDILGHKNPGVTAGYMKQATVEMMREQIEKLYC